MNKILQEISNMEPFSAEYIKENEYKLREEVVRIAHKWLGAKYHVNGMIPYKYCDCHTLLIMVYAEAKLIKLFQPEFYRPDFSFHTVKETYLEGIKKYGVETDTKKPGDIILYRYANLIDHAAIVIDEKGTMIDSCITRGVTLQDYNQEVNKKREVSTYSFWF
jgi:cell wall-associated NlpC family hydrolase